MPSCIELIVESGVDGQKPLRGSCISEALHRSLLLSDPKVRTFYPIILPLGLMMKTHKPQLAER